MEENKRNGAADSTYQLNAINHTDHTNPSGLSKKDKKRQQIGSRLAKLEVTFVNERDNFYRNLLHELQLTLATLQQGNNEELLSKKLLLEEERDYELTKLRLWEEYQVKRIETEYNEDIGRAKENHNRMIKLIKEKLYDKLERQIKQLKEDKLLLNLVNANSWSKDEHHSGAAVEAAEAAEAAAAAAAASGINLHDRRSLRKREFSSRFITAEADDLSDGGGFAGSPTNLPNGYISASKRRRHYATRYSSNDEMSSGITSAPAQTSVPFINGGSSSQTNGHIGSTTANHRTNTKGISSGNDSNLSDKDYDALNSLIMGNDDAGESLNHRSNNNKPNTRGSHKQFTGIQGLRPEELNEDLTLLKNAIGRRTKEY